ncbi:MAG: alkaline phosphatase family protein, partial [Phycisphaerae bacterium]
MILLCGCDSEASRDNAPRETGASAEQRILIVNWDGMEEKIVGPLLSRGELPNLQTLIDAGASGPLETITPSFSPVVWTSIATSRPPADHGILRFRHRVEGRDGMVLYDSRYRRVKALWNILSGRGVASAFIGWWVTWPAERIRG